MKNIISLYFFIFIVILTCPQKLIAQGKINQIITGKVTDQKNTSLPFVFVKVQGTNTGTTTLEDGTFLLEVTIPCVLQFTFMGYQTKDVKVESERELMVLLMEDATVLNEVVVTGYGGTLSRSKLTNSISTVKKETLEKGLFSNPGQALSGSVAGVKVTQSSGKPGANPSIVLRGGTNLDGGGAPLVLVDGQIKGGLSDINPSDIESMEVLKDAGATAIYGARASNGVILVTTKSGKSGRSEINLKSRIGFNYLNNPFDFMNGRDYLFWMRNAYKNSAQIYQDNGGNWKGATTMASLSTASPYGTGNLYWDPNNPLVPLDGNKDNRAIWSTMLLNDKNRFLLNEGYQSMIDPITGAELIFKEFDQAKEAFDNPSITQDYNVSLSGGNDKGKYFASIGYYNDKGLPIKTFYKRLTATFNGEYQIKSWLTSYSNFNFANAKWADVRTTSESNYFARMLSSPPTMRGTNALGEMLLGNNLGDGNPRKNIDAFIQDNSSDKFSLGQSLKFDVMKGLFVKVTANLMYDESINEAFTKDYLQSPNNWNRTRNSSANFTRTIRQTYSAVVNYSKKIEEHTFSALLGGEFYESYNKGFSANGSGAPTDDFMDLGLTSTDEKKRGIDSWHSRNRILSMMGRVNYDYKDRYLFSFTFREDGYSVLLNNRWGFFPGVSAGWVISKEKFMQNTEQIISFAKLRTSYGVNGNAGLGDYQLQGSYGTTRYDGGTGYRMTGIPSPNIKWERSNTFEVGLDLGFLQNVINAGFTYYNRTTTDKFANITLPSSSGVNSILSNNGTLRNSGVEVELGAKLLRNTKDWKLDFNINAAHNKNTIVSLPHNGLERNRQNASQVYGNDGHLKWVGGYQEGQSPGDMYAHTSLGVFKSEEEIRAVAADRKDITSGNNGSNGKTLYGPNAWANLSDADKAKGFPIQPGDVNWKDVNGDGVIDNYDQEHVGNWFPKLSGGFSTSLSWKNLVLSSRFDYALGHKQYDFIRPWFMGNMQGTYNTLTDTKDSWTPDNTNAEYPKYYWADQLVKRNYARSSSMFVYNSSYVCFREIALAYNLPKSIIAKIAVTDLQISATVQNVAYFSGSKLFSPEIGGSVGGGYALPRILIFGASITF